MMGLPHFHLTYPKLTLRKGCKKRIPSLQKLQYIELSVWAVWAVVVQMLVEAVAIVAAIVLIGIEGGRDTVEMGAGVGRTSCC